MRLDSEKMKKYRPLLIANCFLILSVLIGCQTQQNNDPTTIKIDPKLFIPIDLDTLLRYSDIMPLEYTPKALLGEGGTIVFNQDGFFISDYKKPLYHFGPSGSFVKQIGSIGQGPGEYFSSGEMVVSHEGPILLEKYEPTRILFYDKMGKFIKSEQIFKEQSADFAIHPQSGDYYFFSPAFPNLIHRVDPQSLKLKSSFLESDEPPGRSSIPAFFTTCDGRLLFRHMDIQRIYEIVGDTALLKYKFDYGNQYPDYADLTYEERKVMNQGERWYVNAVLDNKSWIYLMVRNQLNKPDVSDEIHHLLVRRSDHSVYRLPGTLEELELFFPKGFWLDEQNNLSIPISPTFLMDKAKWLPYFKAKGIDFNIDGNWFIVTIPLDKVTVD